MHSERKGEKRLIDDAPARLFIEAAKALMLSFAISGDVEARCRNIVWINNER